MYWSPYVPVAARRANARREMDKLRKKGKDIRPIEINGRKITRTFWGNAWCDHLEQFSDYANRLPRGKTYVRNGSVCHLEIDKGEIRAIVSGSELYQIKVAIKPLAKPDWQRIRKNCAGQIGSLLELLQGRLSDSIMAHVTHPKTGLFPKPRDIHLDCDCPDWASLCKHLAAVLYGVGARLDHEPALLFKLRGVNHEDLVSEAIEVPRASGTRRRLDDNLGDVFGVDLDMDAGPVARPRRKKAVNRVKAQASKDIREAAEVVPQKETGFRPTSTNIKRLRKRLGMNKTQFARLIGITPGTVTHWEAKDGRVKLKLHGPARKLLELVAGMDNDAAWERLL